MQSVKLTKKVRTNCECFQIAQNEIDKQGKIVYHLFHKLSYLIKRHSDAVAGRFRVQEFEVVAGKAWVKLGRGSALPENRQGHGESVLYRNQWAFVLYKRICEKLIQSVSQWPIWTLRPV